MSQTFGHDTLGKHGEIPASPAGERYGSGGGFVGGKPGKFDGHQLGQGHHTSHTPQWIHSDIQVL